MNGIRNYTNSAKISEVNILVWRARRKWEGYVKIGRTATESELNSASYVNSVIYIKYIFVLFLSTIKLHLIILSWVSLTINISVSAFLIFK
jgi:hypothetical protein